MYTDEAEKLGSSEIKPTQEAKIPVPDPSGTELSFLKNSYTTPTLLKTYDFTECTKFKNTTGGAF